MGLRKVTVAFQILCGVQHSEVESPEVQMSWGVAAPRGEDEQCARESSNELHSMSGRPQ